MMTTLKNVEIKGFRSIKEMELELRPLNVLIGANGAGKSNLIAFFKLVNELMAVRLQQHIGATGRATGNLHFGPRVTPQLEARLVFEVENGMDTYHMRLFHAAGDSLIFAEETVAFHQEGYPSPKTVELGRRASGNEDWGLGGTRGAHGENAPGIVESLPRLSLSRYIADFQSPTIRLYGRQPLAQARRWQPRGDALRAQVHQ